MRGELVAVDLETTGFDPAADRIIEIGAVRMVNGEIVDEFATLINPERPIPPAITTLTGIRGEDVYNAPGIQTVLPRLKAFVGNAPWMAHNISFDASFLNRLGALNANPRIDTYELASVLMPRAPRYNLTSLTSHFDIDIGTAHRALYDARATAKLYWQLWTQLLTIPLATIREIAELAADLPWDAMFVFKAALQERQHEPYRLPPTVFDLFGGGAKPGDKPLRALEAQLPILPEEIDAILGENGRLSAAWPGYEHRPQQIAMAQAVAQAFNTKKHLLIEAGTGTGKSVAYLVPAVLWGQHNAERVVISTNTLNLQEQLLDKDIPALTDALGVPVQACALKGRGNYLCPRRLASARRRRATSIDELRLIAKILIWLLESQTGDKGEISLRGPDEQIAWNRLSAEDEGCSLDTCRTQMGGICPFYRARRASESAQIVVVNHALLVSDAMTDNRVIPDYRYLVIDEAHHLEEATTSGLSFRVDESALRRRLADLGNTRRGLLGTILAAVRQGGVEKDIRKMEAGIQSIADAVRAMEIHIGTLFSAVRVLVSDAGQATSDTMSQVRVTAPVRNRMSFMNVQAAWGTLAEFFEAMTDVLGQLTRALARMDAAAIPDHADLVSAVESAGGYLGDMLRQLSEFFTAPSANAVYWIAATADGETTGINSAPLHVGELIGQHVWTTKESVVMTSATLQTNRSFDYLKQRLGAETVEAVEVGSPFNYKESTLIFVPTDMPDPNDRVKFQQAVERGLIELAAVLNGRVMALFTSYAQLRQTSQGITPRLALGNIVVFDQSDGTSRQALLDGFRNTPRAVLLGTRSFWEGVDIPGDALSALVIVRLPFTVPTDPVFAARSETYPDSFNAFTMPDAILRFRQGFGRLIRTATDRGVVAIFDNRVVTKSYGAQFIEALPESNVQYAPLANLPEAAAGWLAVARK
ncbi:MAG: helicase C-terminal domain-containing protein [bacterium]|nr:helicase C-terminal domain-containing protein [bacterium]